MARVSQSISAERMEQVHAQTLTDLVLVNSTGGAGETSGGHVPAAMEETPFYQQHSGHLSGRLSALKSCVFYPALLSWAPNLRTR